MEAIYLDNAATSFPKPAGVSDRMKYYLDCVGANVNRSVYTAAQEAGLVTLTLRQRLARLFGFPEPPTHVILTPGATAGLNMIISGLLRPGDHCIVSSMEHNAVMRPLLRLPGVAVSRVPCDAEGFADLDALPGLFRENTRLVIMAHGSNVCGAVQDAAAIGRICAEKGVPLRWTPPRRRDTSLWTFRLSASALWRYRATRGCWAPAAWARCCCGTISPKS